MLNTPCKLLADNCKKGSEFPFGVVMNFGMPGMKKHSNKAISTDLLLAEKHSYLSYGNA